MLLKPIMWEQFNIIQQDFKQNLLNSIHKGFPGGSDGKASACNAGDPGLIPGSGRSPGDLPSRRKWQPTPVFLPGESLG